MRAEPTTGRSLRVLLLVVGTRGDVELHLLLGRALAERGHRVLLASSRFFEPAARAAGLGFAGIGTGTQAELVAFFRSLAGTKDLRQRVERYFGEWAQPQLDASMGMVRALIERSDYLVNNLKTVWSRGDSVVPGANLGYEPQGALEKLAQHRSRLARQGDRVLELVALHRPLVDPTGEWDEPYHFTGFFQPGAAAPPSPGLAAFVAEGAPPVVATLGSMASFDAASWARTFEAALEASSQRAVVVGGWLPEGPELFTSPRVRWVREAPYEWLLPRAACVLHHGGCGTVAAVLRAGVPSILWPQIPSQQYFGELLQEADLASAVLGEEAHSVDATTDAIVRASRDPVLRRSAAEWKDRIATDRGVLEAANAIERHAALLHARESEAD